MNRYRVDPSPLALRPPGVSLAVLGGAALGLAALLFVAVHCVGQQVPQVSAFLPAVYLIVAVGSAALLVALGVHLWTPRERQMAGQVRRALFAPEHGNPLGLKEGEILPSVTCKRSTEEAGVYYITITARTVDVDVLKKLASTLSAALTGPFATYAVSSVNSDPAARFVRFKILDTTVDRTKHYKAVEEMRPERPTLLAVQEGTCIDLTTSGSMLVAGKTRSGKTTGVISLLLQVLLSGPDKFGSKVVIIDPKRAELSRLPHAVTIDDDGEGRAILDAVRDFAQTVTCRQAVLNDRSQEKGDVVKWYEAGMKPSFLFIDEYVALRSILPKKAAKDDDYSVTTFDGLLKQIVTMGASAGCFVIISIAEASVEEGGLPAMLRSAMSTKILFKPTRAEGRLMWSAEQLEAMLDGLPYGPGDAWFSSTDGVHDEVSPVHFPTMDFPAYAELGRLLTDYYAQQ